MPNGTSYQLGNIPTMPAIPMPSLAGDISGGISAFMKSLEEQRRQKALEAFRQSGLDIQAEHNARMAEAQGEQTLNARRLLETAQGREAREIAETQRGLEITMGLAAYFKSKYADLANSPDAVVINIGQEREDQERALELAKARQTSAGGTPSSIMPELARIRSRRQQLFNQRRKERVGELLQQGRPLLPEVADALPLTSEDTTIVQQQLEREFPLSLGLVRLFEGGGGEERGEEQEPQYGQEVAEALQAGRTPRQILLSAERSGLDRGEVLRALEWAQRQRR